MKILHLCYSDLDGGAARAAYRLHCAQRSEGMDSYMLVINKCSDDPYVHTVNGYRKLRIQVASFIAQRILRLQKSTNSVHHSLNLFPSGLLKDIERLGPDIINLHWLGGEMLSISEIARLKQPVVWTLHDMWAFSGAEHYDDDLPSGRYLVGYTAESRHSKHKGFDLDRWVFHRKKKAWADKSFHIVTPSHWLGSCAKKSTLFSRHSIQVISNCIDHNRYKALPTELARHVLGLPPDKKLLLFGAMSSTSDPRKGYHLLITALQRLKIKSKTDNPELVIFGASHGEAEEETGLLTHYMGQLNDDISLCLLYNSVDLFIAPSLQDNLPNTLVESLACGTPCVAFNIGGMSDLVNCEVMGQLAKSVKATELSLAISTQLGKENYPEKVVKMSQSIRASKNIATKYLQIYKDT